MQQDLYAARQFLSTITADWSEGDRLNIRCIAAHGKITQDTFPADRLDEAIAFAAAANDGEYNVYACINPARTQTQSARDTDIRRAHYLYVDADDGHAWERIQSFDGPEPTILVQTGTEPAPRGHAYWRLEEPITSNEFREAQGRLIDTLQTDKAVRNPSRVMRVPGFVSYPDERKQARGYTPEVVSTVKMLAEKRTYLANIAPAVEQPMLAEKKIYSANDSPPETMQQSASVGLMNIDFGHEGHDWDALMAQSRAPGLWHQSVLKLSASAIAKGMSASQFIAQYAQALTLPGYSAERTARELDVMLRGATAKYSPSNQTALPPLQDAVVDDEDFERIKAGLVWAHDITEVAASPYIVKGMLASKSLSMLYGPSNSGKSFLALHLAASISTGTPWFGRKVEQAPVLYLAAEGEYGIRNRVLGLRQTFSIPEWMMAFRFSDIDFLHGSDCSERTAKELDVIERLSGLRPSVVVVDTLSQSMAGGDENDPADMTKVIRNLGHIARECSVTILLVHHLGKDATRGARGHSSLRAAIDTEIEISVGETGVRTASVTKQRDMPFGEPIHFTLQSIILGMDEDGDDITTAMAIQADAVDLEMLAEAQRPQPKGNNQIAIRDGFFQLRNDGVGAANPGGTGFPPGGAYWCIDADKLQEHVMGRISGTKASYKAAFDKLLAIDYLCQNDGRVWIVRDEGRV